MTFNLGTVSTNANPFVSFCHMIELCQIDQLACFRLGLTRVQQSVWAKWHIQDGGQLSKTVPSLPAIAHKSETSTATKFEMA